MKDVITIVQFDSDENYATIVDLICFNLKLDSGKYFRSVKEANMYISMISKTKEFPNIAIISNYLGTSRSDGEEIAKKLRELNPSIKIIAYTVDDETAWGDYLALKSKEDKEHDIIDILSKLTGKEFNFDNSKSKVSQPN